MRKGVLRSLLWIVLYLAVALALWMAFLYAPRERTMGDVQRIFYFHVPSAWSAFLAFFLVFLGSLLYLWRPAPRWDRLAASAAEVGLLFCTVVLVTGPIWAKPVWGIWWTWDARLTSTLVLWLVYAAYVLVRRTILHPEKRAVYSAVLGIVGFIDVPLVYMSIRWWRTQHPKPVIAGGAGSGLAPPMLQTFLVCLAAVTLLAIVLVWQRMRLHRLEDEVEWLTDRIEEDGAEPS
jgi:heme exporter protein C